MECRYFRSVIVRNLLIRLAAANRPRRRGFAAPATRAVSFTSGESARSLFSSGGTYDSGNVFVPGISLGFRRPFRHA
jgi:hypothetical protein